VPGEVYSESGTINGEEPICEFYEAIIRHAFHLIGKGSCEPREDGGYEYRFNIFS
jgi:predicted hydrocarbon binding protein